MIPTTAAVRTTDHTTTPPAVDVPIVEGRDRAALVLGAGVIVAALGVAVVGTLVARSAADERTAPIAPATTAAVTSYAVGDASHGGPGSRTDALRRSASSSASHVPAPAGELSHGGPGSRSDSVRPLAPRPSEVLVADVAHGSAGSVVIATAARP